MNADRLFAVYDRVADAPDAVGRLRRFVLDLAVRGKLVEQDPADEPASELLKRIAAEKARMVRAGRLEDPASCRTVIQYADSGSLPHGYGRPSSPLPISKWVSLLGLSITIGLAMDWLSSKARLISVLGIPRRATGVRSRRR